MKKIVLIDLDCQLIHSLYTSNNMQIDTLIVSSNKQIDEINKIYTINHVLSMESINHFYNKQKVDLDYRRIELFRHTQLKVEHFLSRLTTDINAIQYIYYNALAYWFEKFEKEDLDAVVSAGIEFGGTFDSIIYDVAQYYKKKVYIMEVGLNNGSIIANQLFDYTLKEHIKIEPEKYGLKTIDKSEFLYNSKVAVSPLEKLTLKELIKYKSGKFGGYLLVMFVAWLMGKYKSVHHTFNVNWWTYFRNYIHSKRMKKYYDSLSIKFDKSTKYVYYALHMEPEAATLARTTFANQLVIIKTLAENLPNGWKLFVKEHPHQFSNLNNFQRYYFLASLDKFKTKRFYDEIVSLPNTALLKMNSNNKDIIAHARAISTINGTIILESIALGKPLVLFSQGTSPFIHINDIASINTSEECKNTLDIINQNFIPDYQNYDEVLRDYFFEVELKKNVDYCHLVDKLIEG